MNNYNISKFIKVRNKKTGEVTFLNEEDIEKYYKNKDFEIFCCCNGEIPLTISFLNDHYIKTLSGFKEKHAENCSFCGKSKKSIPGIKEDDQGNTFIEVALERKSPKKILPPTNIVNQKPGEQTVRKNVKSLRGAFEDHITKVWNKKYNEKYINNGILENAFSPSKICGYLLSEKYRLYVNGKQLSKYMDYSDFGKKITIGYLGREELDNYVVEKNDVKFTCFFANGMKKIIRVNKELFEMAIHENSNIGYESLICIVVSKRKRSSWFETCNLVFIPVNQYGLYAESLLECKLYNMLFEDGFLFEKPIDIFDNNKYPFKPDAIIHEEQKWLVSCPRISFEPNKKTLVELFGVNSDEDYDKNKEKKMKYGEEINQTNKDLAFYSLDRKGLEEIINKVKK